MRLIGHLETETAATQFSDYLLAEGFMNHLEPQPPEGWAIWVEEEDKLADAAERLKRFRANPSAAEFRNRSAVAKALRAEHRKEQQAYAKQVRTRGDLFRPLAAFGLGPLTFLLMMGSVVVFLLSRFGTDNARIMPLFMSNFMQDENYIRFVRNLPEIRHGQLWRLVTPIFIHGNILHIFFNLLWLRDLGSMIEARQGSLYLALLVLVLAVGSNLGQFYYAGPAFGGMSGVIYGLLGYVWLRGRFDPGSGLFLHQSTVTLMIIWFVLCWSGLLGATIANMAHTVGLLMGLAWGSLAAVLRR